MYLITAFFKFNVFGINFFAVYTCRFGVRSLKLSSLMGYRELDSYGGVGILDLFCDALICLFFGHSLEVDRFTTSRLFF